MLKCGIQEVRFDIVNRCNLRCPFCVVDRERKKKTVLMDDATFDKLATLAPLVGKGRFRLSCLHEPTMHPRFLEFIYRLPQHQRGKIFFATNLTLPLRDEFIDRLARSGVGRISISVDSLNESTYESMRVNATYGQLRANLSRLFAALDRNRGLVATEIEYIIVVCRQNIGEIIEMVRACFADLRARRVEVREFQNLPHFEKSWGKQNVVTEAEWSNLALAMKELPVTHELRFNGSNKKVRLWPRGMPYCDPDAGARPVGTTRPPFVVRVKEAGDTSIGGVSRDDFSTNINLLPDPHDFFLRLSRSSEPYGAFLHRYLDSARG